MNILIRTDSSHHTGSGHVMRTLALTEELIDKGHRVIFVSSAMLPNLHNRILDTGAKISMIKCEISSQQDVVQTLKISEELEIDAVIIDGYQFNEEYLLAINGKYKVLFFDDEAKLNNISADIIVNGSSLAYKLPYNDIAKKAKLLLGPEYIVLRKEFISKYDKILPLEMRHNILVTFGGTDPLELTLPVVQNLLAIIDKDQKIDVVVNSEINLPLNPQVIIHKNCDYMADLMQSAGLAISAGGTTISELAFMQVPTLLVVVADNQANHASNVNIIDARKLSRLKVADQIAQKALMMMENSNLRKDLIEKNMPFFNGEGARKIEKELNTK